MVGTFVPFHAKPRYKTASAKVGWVIAENGCHIWQGAKDSCGYGMVRFEGKSRKVHSLRYALEVGPVPEGMELDHFVCSDRLCCNPAHQRPVSHRENVLRGRSFAARNIAKTHCVRGHPLSGDNLIPWWLKKGWRKCNTCNNEASNARYHARKARTE